MFHVEHDYKIIVLKSYPQFFAIFLFLKLEKINIYPQRFDHILQSN